MCIILPFISFVMIMEYIDPRDGIDPESSFTLTSLFVGIYFAILSLYVIIYTFKRFANDSTKELTRKFSLISSFYMLLFVIYKFSMNEGNIIETLFLFGLCIYGFKKYFDGKEEEEENYQCPECKKEIEIGTKKCKNCGCKLDWSDIADEEEIKKEKKKKEERKYQELEEKQDFRQCKECGNFVKENAVACPKCGAYIGK